MGSSKVYAFSLDIEPVAKGRPRFGRLPGGGVRTRPHAKSSAFEARVALLSGPYAPRAPLLGSLRLGVVFWITPPKRLERAAPSVKPDLDNLLKSLLDGLELGGWFETGDQQITELNAVKRYALGRRSGIDVEIEVLGSAQ